jgi:hypothetical protein
VQKPVVNGGQLVDLIRVVNAMPAASSLLENRKRFSQLNSLESMCNGVDSLVGWDAQLTREDVNV